MIRLAPLTLIGLLLMASIFSARAEDSCAMMSYVCVEGPETRIIEGIEVTRDCWRYEAEYFCYTGENIDSCSPLAQNGCAKTSETCTTTNPFTGECVLSTMQYQCGELQTSSEATLLDSSYTITRDEIDASACSDEEAQECQLLGQTCLEGAETRVINGLEVTKDCWSWQYEYVCMAATYSNFCAPLENLCVEESSVCTDTLWNGECGVTTKTYNCDTEQAEKDGVVKVDEQFSIIEDSIDSSDCNDESSSNECVLVGTTCVEGAETRTINGLPVYKECWAYQDEYTCLSGEMTTTCDDSTLEPCTITDTTCLVTASDGHCTAISYIYSCEHKTSDSEVLSCADQVFCLGDDCYDTGYEPSGSFGLAAAYLGAAAKSGTDVEGSSIDDIDIFTAHTSQCTQYPANTVDCCKDSGWANGSVTGCSNADLILINERAEGLTHYVGTYCSSKIPIIGTCIEYKQNYCSYESMLARIIQEGGREQLGYGWGAAKNPDCTGFSAEELQALDFTLIDFTEYINQQTTTMLDEAELTQRVQDAISELTN
jgi:conjugal transfer mating pair stabilization protein TraN